MDSQSRIIFVLPIPQNNQNIASTQQREPFRGDADPQFANSIYNYTIQPPPVAVKGKLLADAGYWLIPWISASLGVGFNDAHSFNNF